MICVLVVKCNPCNGIVRFCGGKKCVAVQAFFEDVVIRDLFQVMVFFSSCNSVKYHHELLNYIDISCMSIHVSVYIKFFSLISFPFL